MATQKHLQRLGEGKAEWNRWRKESTTRPNLSGADLIGRNLAGFDLRGADLRRSLLVEAQMRGAALDGADLSHAVARFAMLSRARLVGATLKGTDLRGASLRRADLTDANLEGAILRFTSMVEAVVRGASFHAAEVYGIGAWNLVGEPANQASMVIREHSKAVATTIDDLDTAQFIHLIRDNARIADIIDSTSRRTVLLLGRFSPPHKAVLDMLRDELLQRNWVPVLFDFNRPDSRDLTETVASLAHMACFVVANVTGARSIPQELSFIIPYLPSVPVLPILREGAREYAMFEHFQRYPWVLPTLHFRDMEHLREMLDHRILERGFREAMRLRGEQDAPMPGPVPAPPTRKRKVRRKRAVRRT